MSIRDLARPVDVGASAALAVALQDGLNPREANADPLRRQRPLKHAHHCLDYLNGRETTETRRTGRGMYHQPKLSSVLLNGRRFTGIQHPETEFEKKMYAQTDGQAVTKASTSCNEQVEVIDRNSNYRRGR